MEIKRCTICRGKEKPEAPFLGFKTCQSCRARAKEYYQRLKTGKKKVSDQSDDSDPTLAETSDDFAPAPCVKSKPVHIKGPYYYRIENGETVFYLYNETTKKATVLNKDQRKDLYNLLINK